MDKQFKKQLYVWVYEKIKDNPKEFGGDSSNNLITSEYLKEFYGDCIVNELEPRVFSIVSTVSRIKNKLLEKNPHFDNRTKYISKQNRSSNEMGNKL